MDIEKCFADAVRAAPSLEELDAEVGEMWMCMTGLGFNNKYIDDTILKYVTVRPDGSYAKRKRKAA